MKFETIDMPSLLNREETLRREFGSRSPFKYVVIENFLLAEHARRIYSEFPPIDKKSWVDGNGLHTKNKWAMPCVAGTVADRFYSEVNSADFLEFMVRITGIQGLARDSDLFGAGYHQILDGGFLDVHIDFNKHDKSGLDRRLNLIVYLNPDWKDAYGGNLELWDMQRRVRLENLAPNFNRCVVFETNEVSFHGHPRPLNTGGKTTRKSLSVYYYSQGREDGVAAPVHNTIYKNTQGARGALKLLRNGLLDILRFGWLKRRMAK